MDQGICCSLLSERQGHTFHGGNEAEIFIRAILGGKKFLGILWGEENFLGILGGENFST